jgi:hypothetical protein
MLSGFVAFALFCFTLTISLRAVGIAPAFLLATAAALLGQGALIARAERT